jgi:hypothetical protein
MRKALPIAAAGVSPDTQLASGRHQADPLAEPGHDSEETTMRPAFLYYLVQTWTADPYRQAQREAPARAASQARRTCTPRRGYRVRRLPAVVNRRMLTMLGGGSP